MHAKSSPARVPGNKVELFAGVSDSVSGVAGNYAINPRLCSSGPPLTHHFSFDQQRLPTTSSPPPVFKWAGRDLPLTSLAVWSVEGERESHVEGHLPATSAHPTLCSFLSPLLSVCVCACVPQPPVPHSTTPIPIPRPSPAS